MPIFIPCPAGGGGSGFAVANGTVLNRFEMLNTGTDLGINFQAGIFDDIANRVVVAGDGTYVGSHTLVTDKIIQAPSLPVISASIRGIAVERLTGGIFVLDQLNAISLSDANLDNWAAINSGAANVRGIFALTDTNNIYAVFDELAAPARNVAVSTDQGTTWDINPGIFAPITDIPRFTVMSPDKSHVAICSENGGDIAVSADPVNTWVAHTIATAQDVQCAAFSTDNSMLVVIDQLGRIFWTATPLVGGAMNEVPFANNPYVQTVASGRPGAFIVFSDALAGFVSMDTGSVQAIYIPFADPDTTEQGLYVGALVGFPGAERYSPPVCVDNNNTFQALCTGNDTVILLA